MEDVNNTTNDIQYQEVNINPKNGSIAYILAFFFFFCSFFVVQCGEGRDILERKISGIDIATGVITNAMNESQTINHPNKGYIETPTSMWATIALFCVIIGAAISIFYNKKAALLSWRIGLVGVISMIILPIDLYIKWRKQIPMEAVHFKISYFAALVCLIAATYYCKKRYDEIFK